MTLGLSSQSQNKQADSLVSILNETESNQARLSLLNQISNAYKYTSNGAKVVSYALEAAVLSGQLNDNTALGNAYFNLGSGHIILSKHEKAIEYLKKAKNIYEAELKKEPSVALKKSIARALGNIGLAFLRQGNYTGSFQYNIKSIAIYEELQDTVMLSLLNNNIGATYKSQKEYDKALEYLNKAKDTQVLLNDPNIGVTLTNIAICHLKLRAFPKALSFFNDAEPLVKNDPSALGEWNNSIGSYYFETKNHKKAMQHWDDAIVAFNSFEDKFGIAVTYILKGELLLEQNNYNEAIKNANLAVALALETNLLEPERDAEKVISEAYDKLNNIPQALKHYKKYITLNQSIANVENIRKGVQAQMNFEYQKKENKERLEREKQELLLIEENKQKKTQYLFLFISALLLMGLGFLLYNRKQLKQRLTLEKELTEYEQKALHLQMNPHFIFNCLGAISGFIINNGTDHAIKYLSKFSKLMRLTLEYSKESLIPIGKEIESLKNYLELEKLRFNNAFNFTITKSDVIEDDVAIPPLLIQPIVENAIIHGIVPKKKNGEISINFSTEKDNIICTIIDNGIGIDKSVASKKDSFQIHKSMALDIINKRLKMITKVANKKASIKSFQLYNGNGESEGTKVIILLPMQYID